MVNETALSESFSRARDGYVVGDPEIRRISTAEYIARFRDVPRFEGLCRECHNYGTRWGCPPFDDDRLPDLEKWKTAEIWLLKLVISPDKAAAGLAWLNGIIQAEREPFERILLYEERRRGGFAALVTGMCPHCGAAPCARLSAKPCRHPDLVRPSLEALGFDLGKTAGELFGLPLRWSANGRLPDYVSLIGGLFY